MCPCPCAGFRRCIDARVPRGARKTDVILGSRPPRHHKLDNSPIKRPPKKKSLRTTRLYSLYSCIMLGKFLWRTGEPAEHSAAPKWLPLAEARSKRKSCDLLRSTPDCLSSLPSPSLFICFTRCHFTPNMGGRNKLATFYEPSPDSALEHPSV